MGRENGTGEAAREEDFGRDVHGAEDIGADGFVEGHEFEFGGGEWVDRDAGEGAAGDIKGAGDEAVVGSGEGVEDEAVAGGSDRQGAEKVTAAGGVAAGEEAFEEFEGHLDDFALDDGGFAAGRSGGLALEGEEVSEVDGFLGEELDAGGGGGEGGVGEHALEELGGEGEAGVRVHGFQAVAFVDDILGGVEEIDGWAVAEEVEGLGDYVSGHEGGWRPG